MAVHNEVDIALDSYPQAGTTTTAHTLWMGVPLVTRRVAAAGRRHLHRRKRRHPGPASRILRQNGGFSHDRDSERDPGPQQGDGSP